MLLATTPELGTIVSINLQNFSTVSRNINNEYNLYRIVLAKNKLILGREWDFCAEEWIFCFEFVELIWQRAHLNNKIIIRIIFFTNKKTEKLTPKDPLEWREHPRPCWWAFGARGRRNVWQQPGSRQQLLRPSTCQSPGRSFLVQKGRPQRP